MHNRFRDNITNQENIVGTKVRRYFPWGIGRGWQKSVNRADVSLAPLEKERLKSQGKRCLSGPRCSAVSEGRRLASPAIGQNKMVTQLLIAQSRWQYIAVHERQQMRPKRKDTNYFLWTLLGLPKLHNSLQFYVSSIPFLLLFLKLQQLLKWLKWPQFSLIHSFQWSLRLKFS